MSKRSRRDIEEALDDTLSAIRDAQAILTESATDIHVNHAARVGMRATIARLDKAISSACVLHRVATGIETIE